MCLNLCPSFDLQSTDPYVVLQMTPHIPTVVNIFSQVLGKGEVMMELRQLILAFCKQIMTQLGYVCSPLRSACAGLCPLDA